MNGCVERIGHIRWSVFAGNIATISGRYSEILLVDTRLAAQSPAAARQMFKVGTKEQSKPVRQR